MKTFAIILAAGRGSRMKGLTADRPKCMLNLAGRPLLHWQKEALNGVGINNIHIVRGYRRECFPENFSFSHNPDWADTNMVYSLMCAEDHIEEMFGNGFEQFIISYADIVYHGQHVRDLMKSGHDLAITYDTMWEELWKLRFANVLDDAETFLQKDGFLAEIGGRPNSMAEISGQYMGLLKLTRNGWRTWRDAAAGLGPQLRKTDMTTFLRHLLNAGNRIAAVPVSGKWCEADSASDLENYEKTLDNGAWSHDWRMEQQNETR